jgi:hypothetical protein
MWHIHTIEYYSTLLKEREFDIVLKEIRQPLKKRNICIISCI